MIAVDTNILIYAHRRDLPWHEQAHAVLNELSAGLSAWAIPWPCVSEFISTATHPKVFSPPSTIDQAFDQLSAWQEAPTLVMLAETGNYLGFLRKVITRGRVAGPKAHDARIAALCLAHGVRELWSADRDFSRFPDLKVVNPLISPV
jgi:hypothetical protein